jgi:pyruvate dehydrogenase E2 component (dihydrolipoamide acetyltransferase)
VNDLLAIIGNKGEDISGLLKENGAAGAAKDEQPKAEQPKPDQSKQEQPKQESKKEAPKQDTSAPAIDISKMEEVILMPRLRRNCRMAQKSWRPGEEGRRACGY